MTPQAVEDLQLDLKRCKTSLLAAVTERDQLRTESTDLKYRLDLQVRDAIALQTALTQNVAYDQRATEAAWQETRDCKAALEQVQTENERLHREIGIAHERMRVAEDRTDEWTLAMQVELEQARAKIKQLEVVVQAARKYRDSVGPPAAVALTEMLAALEAIDDDDSDDGCGIAHS